MRRMTVQPIGCKGTASRPPTPDAIGAGCSCARMNRFSHHPSRRGNAQQGLLNTEDGRLYRNGYIAYVASRRLPKQRIRSALYVLQVHALRHLYMWCVYMLCPRPLRFCMPHISPTARHIGGGALPIRRSNESRRRPLNRAGIADLE